MFLKITAGEIDSTSHIVALQELNTPEFWQAFAGGIALLSLFIAIIYFDDRAHNKLIIGCLAVCLISSGLIYAMHSSFKEKEGPLVVNANAAVSEILQSKYGVELREQAFDSRGLGLDESRSAVTADGIAIKLKLELVNDNTELVAYSDADELKLLTSISE